MLSWLLSFYFHVYSIRRIETTKPHGMTVSNLRNVSGEPFQKAVDISWIPTTEQVGKHQLGFNAVDRDG